MKKIKIMIAEDHKMFREAITEKIQLNSPHIEVIAAVENGLELLKAVKNKVPDIILLDIYMPEMNGWKVLEILKVEFPQIKVVMFSGEFLPVIVSQAILAGASAFIDKWKSDEKDIIDAIESVFAHGYFFNDVVSQEIIIELKKKKQSVNLEEDQRFSEREREVIDLICKGKQIKEIAVSLNISDGTVKYHKGNVFKKTESNTNMDLLKYAISQGIYNVFQEKPKKRG